MPKFHSRLLSLAVLFLVAVACFGWQEQRSVSADPPSKKSKTQTKKSKTARKPVRGNQGSQPADDPGVTGTAAGGVAGSGTAGGSSAAGGAFIQNGGAPAGQTGAGQTGTGQNGAGPAGAGKGPTVSVDPSGAGNPGPAQKVVDAVKAVQEKYTKQLMSQEGIVGTATGLSKDGDGTVVVKVYTSGAGNPKIPAKLDGVPVEEVLTGPWHLHWQTTPFDPTAHDTRPVHIGVSTINATGPCAAGTIGCRLKANDGSGFYALSNNHVFANENSAVIGSDCLQPGTLDQAPGNGADCTPITADIVGTLFKFKVVDITGGNNVFDAAIIKTDAKLVGNATPPVAYGQPRTTAMSNPYLGLAVQKYGRTTGYTTGTIMDLNGTISVGFSTGTAIFVQQITIVGDNGTPFGMPGDSGSLVVSMPDRFPVAIVQAGPADLSFASCNPIQPILDYFGMTVDGDNSAFIPPGKSMRSQQDAP